MKRITKRLLILVFTFFAHAVICNGQTWVDTLYQIQVMTDSVYGSVIDFAGNERALKLDIAIPLDDQPPECGRPLLIAIHGGAFITGSKSEGILPRILSDFAKRGYVTASINYRLGMFQTNSMHHCNISGLEGVEWDCLNMADTTEWHRAYYRGVQDAKGAIRYMINHSDEFQINPENVFVFGESAGGFIALGTAFLDDVSETPYGTGALPDALAPNQIYDVQCVQTYGFDTSIAQMDLGRPDLGGIDGELNYQANQAFSVKGVGNFYGGIFTNLFIEQHDAFPAIYMFHQPNDLIVPFNCNPVLSGYSYCATMFPFNCAGLLNRPEMCGSRGIANMIDDMAGQGLNVPEYQLANTNNTADCFAQILNPALGGHQVDNFWLRTVEMATFFAPHIDTCTITGTADLVSSGTAFKVFPNPVSNELFVEIKPSSSQISRITIYNIFGDRIMSAPFSGNQSSILLDPAITNGTYFITLDQDGILSTQRIVVIR